MSGRRRPAGSREISLDAVLYRTGQNALAPGELITALVSPRSGPGIGCRLRAARPSEGMELRPRRRCSSPDAGGDGGACEARNSHGLLRTGPASGEKRGGLPLRGPLDEKRLREAARLTAGETSPISDMRACADNRREMVEVLAFRAYTAAWQAARTAL